MTQPTFFDDIYLLNASAYLPGSPVDNEQIDHYIAPLEGSTRIKQRILKENGIRQRHYAIDKNGHTHISHTDMACAAVRDCLEGVQLTSKDIDLLTAASSGGDVLIPGLANMIQGRLHAPPMETHSHHGVCASGILALKDAAQSLHQNPTQQLAVTVAAEMPSRMFKRSRFASQGYATDFETAFLRYMLSDGAGAVVLGKANQVTAQTATQSPLSRQSLALRLDWIHAKSFSGDYPVCMQLGQGSHRKQNTEQQCRLYDLDKEASFLDFPGMNEAEAAGHFNIRQNLRLLPNLFDVAVHEYAQLVQNRHIDPHTVDTFLCHYSSEALGETCDRMMQEAGLGIPREKWFSNLTERGNTGAASIFIMLADFLQDCELHAGQKILGFVPESGRFTVSYFMLTVVDTDQLQPSESPAKQFEAGQHNVHELHTPNNTNDKPEPPEIQFPQAPHTADGHEGLVRETLLELAGIWHQFRSDIWRTPLISRINERAFTPEDYVSWMAQWIPQVREGSLWMRRAVESLDEDYKALASLITHHANDEQHDFKILFEDYQLAGGQETHIDQLQRNPGGEALNSYMYRAAQTRNPVGLLGGIYIIEGTGQRIVPWLLPQLKAQLTLPERCFRFLHYHGENDEEHLQHWLIALELALDYGGKQTRDSILQTARDVALLYRLQMEHIL
ncbi:MAG: 3-oxoacyl-[acyl-carrier-protein] synthase III C-terminal domain-containing protein [Thiolinea sp.]